MEQDSEAGEGRESGIGAGMESESSWRGRVG